MNTLYAHIHATRDHPSRARAKPAHAACPALVTERAYLHRRQSAGNPDRPLPTDTDHAGPGWAAFRTRCFGMRTSWVTSSSWPPACGARCRPFRRGFCHLHDGRAAKRVVRRVFLKRGGSALPSRRLLSSAAHPPPHQRRTAVTRPASFYLAWSRWRRGHQACARASHYRA
jgi:hypothetical protein